MNLYDKDLKAARVCERECDTCIFKPQGPFRSGDGRLRPGRFKQLVADTVRDESYIVCHETTSGKPAMCRGFSDRFSTNMTRILTRLGIVEVPCSGLGSDSKES